MTTMQKLTVEKNDPRLCIAGTEHLWSVCLKNRDKLGISTEVLAENVVYDDAVLFAAAPDLLEALKEIADDYCDRFDMDSPTINPGIKNAVSRARAAIAKAEGGES